IAGGGNTADAMAIDDNSVVLQQLPSHHIEQQVRTDYRALGDGHLATIGTAPDNQCGPCRCPPAAMACRLASQRPHRAANGYVHVRCSEVMSGARPHSASGAPTVGAGRLVMTSRSRAT